MSRIAILDLDSVAFAIGNPNKILDEQGNPVKVKSAAGNMVFSTVEKTVDELKQSADVILTDILNACNAEAYIGFIKGSNTTTTRLQVNPEYKQNRKKESPWWWQTVKTYLIDKWKAVEANGLEVDDAVNITRLMNPDSFIVAIDGDLLGLEGTHYNWKKKEWIKVSLFDAEKKFWSDMICGQTGDNIQGLSGKGEKHFEKTVLKAFENGGRWATFTLNEYLKHYQTEKEAIKEFYKNYFSLKILESKEGFTIPEPIKWPRIQVEILNDLFK